MLDIWLASPEGFYTETAEDIETFMGVASATMYRDDRWKIVAYHSTVHDDLGELYDLENDPWEFTDLWHNPEYRDLKLQLLKKNFDARVLSMDPGPPQTMSF